MTIFRMYDIRGRVDDELTPEMAERIGRAFARMAWERVVSGARPPCVAVGRDVRPSSPKLAAALMAGMTRFGVDVLDIGLCTTPLLYYTLHRPPDGPVAGGIMITGSHNPPAYNGMKLCLGTDTLYGEALQRIGQLVHQRRQPTASEEGTVRTAEIIPEYLAYVAASIAAEQGASRLKIVVDAGNGTAGLAAPALLRRLGCDVIELFCEPDGRFPNHHPDPTIPANLAELIRTVRAERADFGVAYDGDADRIGVVDDRGAILWGDRLLTLFARAVLAQRPGSTVIADVKSSLIVPQAVAAAGGRFVLWKTGHSLIKAKMRECGALLAGEMSGHIFFADRYFGFDDAVYATARLTELVRRARSGGRRLSDLANELPATHATPEIRLDCPDADKFAVVARLGDEVKRLQPSWPLAVKAVNSIDGARIEFDGGWGLVRASNTQPVIVVRCEAETAERLHAIQAAIGELIRAAAGACGLYIEPQWDA
ncbi:MAG: phosphomannomutase/phosphoglucomutase [Nitrospirota bacterium]